MVNAALLPPASVSSSHDSRSRTSATLPEGEEDVGRGQNQDTWDGWSKTIGNVVFSVLVEMNNTR